MRLLYAQGGHAFGLLRTKFPITGWPSLVETWVQLTLADGKLTPFENRKGMHLRLDFQQKAATLQFAARHAHKSC